MIPRWARLSRAPLFIQVLILMAGVFIAAQLISFVGFFNLPQPAPITYSYDEIVRAYNGNALPEDRALIIEHNARPPESSFNSSPADAVLGGSMRREMARRVTGDIQPWDVILESNWARWREYLGERNTRGDDFFLTAPFKVGFRQADDSWTVVRSPPSLRLDPWQQRLVVWFSMLTVAMIVAAYLVARLLAAPIVAFARAAERLGRDPNARPVAIKGSPEITTAARAFNEMQERLRRYVEDRTAMIGAIAHDLRTPLTRLRFRIEGAPEETREKMSSDLDQMEAMISATLSFVRDATQEATRTKLELSSVVESLADEMSETGSDVTLERSEKVVLDGDPIALKRMFSNLLDNAVKYGKRARVRVYREDDTAIVEVDDDGPGLPEADLERVFEPFYRREPSRSRDTGGIGLGLAVVRTVARAHGGDAFLLNRGGEGLRAQVRLPI